MNVRGPSLAYVDIGAEKDAVQTSGRCRNSGRWYPPWELTYPYISPMLRALFSRWFSLFPKVGYVHSLEKNWLACIFLGEVHVHTDNFLGLSWAGRHQLNEVLEFGEMEVCLSMFWELAFWIMPTWELQLARMDSPTECHRCLKERRQVSLRADGSLWKWENLSE